MPESFDKRIAHECFRQPESRDLIVWRYMTLAKFVSLLQTRSLFLCRLDLLDDPHEGATPKILIEERQRFVHNNPGILETMIEFTKEVRKIVYVNCWNLSDHESGALWRLYSAGHDGVAIHATYEGLVDVIRGDDDLYVGRITYIDYESEWFPAGNLLYPVMHKRRAFAYEREVRLVKVVWGNRDNPSIASGLTIPVDLEKLIKGIHISPYCPEWFSDTVSAIVGKFAPQLADRISWSRMKAIPRY
jgi:hypothetical protein